jgi:hypothetical protein
VLAATLGRARVDRVRAGATEALRCHELRGCANNQARLVEAARHPRFRGTDLMERSPASTLAGGKRAFVVTPYEWTFANHKRCRRFG